MICLRETFKKFDIDNSGILEKPEFVKAWNFLGLNGSDAEIERAFESVDTDRSGKIDRGEFKRAIKEARTTELSLTVILSQMDGHLEGLEDFFAEYKKKLEDSKGSFDRFRASERRRRLMARHNREKIAELTRTLVADISVLVGSPEEDKQDADRELYKNLKDTFNAFDKEGIRKQVDQL